MHDVRKSFKMNWTEMKEGASYSNETTMYCISMNPRRIPVLEQRLEVGGEEDININLLFIL